MLAKLLDNYFLVFRQNRKKIIIEQLQESDSEHYKLNNIL